MRQVDGGEDGTLIRGGLSDAPSALGNLIRLIVYERVLFG